MAEQAMGNGANAAADAGPARGRCRNSDCCRTRQRLTNFMAARAMEARKALDLEVRLGVAEALAGRAAPRPARSGEGLSAMNEHTARLAGLKGQIDTHRGDEHARGEALRPPHQL